MAIYHLHAKIIKRSAGQSAVACAAYRSGTSLYDARTGQTHDFTKKGEIVHSAIMVSESSPDWIKAIAVSEAREQLWNEVEAKERRLDAQVAREVEFALPKELNREQQITLSRSFVQKAFVNHGMVADLALHDKNVGNPHVHVMLTMRTIEEDGFGNKVRAWNEKKLLEEWRSLWADEANKFLQMVGIEEHIDHRTLIEQGRGEAPGIHEGVHARAMKKKGLRSERCAQNEQIRNGNVIYLNAVRRLRDEQAAMYDLINMGSMGEVLNAHEDYRTYRMKKSQILASQRKLRNYEQTVKSYESKYDKVNDEWARLKGLMEDAVEVSFINRDQGEKWLFNLNWFGESDIHPKQLRGKKILGVETKDRQEALAAVAFIRRNRVRFHELEIQKEDLQRSLTISRNAYKTEMEKLKQWDDWIREKQNQENEAVFVNKLKRSLGSVNRQDILDSHLSDQQKQDLLHVYRRYRSNQELRVHERGSENELTSEKNPYELDAREIAFLDAIAAKKSRERKRGLER